MVLVDTSVWVDHLARGDSELQVLLEDGEVLIHPFVIAEIALGSLPRRTETIDALRALPHASVATHEEVMTFLHDERLFGLGIGFVDLHLLAAMRLAAKARLWTRDKRLRRAASTLGFAAFPALIGPHESSYAGRLL